MPVNEGIVMDQRTTIGASATFARPIHRACVVPGCWCGATVAGARSAAGDRLRVASRTAPAATYLTHVALRSVGLPVV